MSVLKPCFLFTFVLSGELIGVEYLCSQQSWEFRENFGRDPDAPDRIPDDLGDAEDEGFGDEAEEQDHTISPLSLVSTKVAVRLSRDSASPSQSSQDLSSEPQEDVCMHAGIPCHAIIWRSFFHPSTNFFFLLVRCAEDQTGRRVLIEWWTWPGTLSS